MSYNTCVWTTKKYTYGMAPGGNEGILFKLGDPVHVEWYSGGRFATRDEVQIATDEGIEAVRAKFTELAATDVRFAKYTENRRKSEEAELMAKRKAVEALWPNA